MIDVVKRTPEEYSKQSRDYQIIARLYSALFNVSKMYIDNMDIWNEDIDNKLADLRARTLNFVPKYSWDLSDLESITSCFKYLVRRKGTMIALTVCINILMKIRNVSFSKNKQAVNYNNNTGEVIFYLDKEMIGMGIIEDLIRYLLPAGLCYRIIEYSEMITDDDILEDVEINVEDLDFTEKHEEFSEKMKIGTSKPKPSDDKKQEEGKIIEDTFIYRINSEGEFDYE